MGWIQKPFSGLKEKLLLLLRVLPEIWFASEPTFSSWRLMSPASPPCFLGSFSVPSPIRFLPQILHLIRQQQEHHRFCAASNQHRHLLHLWLIWSIRIVVSWTFVDFAFVLSFGLFLFLTFFSVYITSNVPFSFLPNSRFPFWSDVFSSERFIL